MPSTVTELITQFQEVTQEQRVLVDKLELELAVQKASLTNLEKALSALSGDKPKKRVARGPYNGAGRAAGGIKPQIVAALQGSSTAMDLGALSKAVFGVDDSRHRTKISAALTNEVANPQGEIRRVGAGIYATREASQT